MTGANADGKRRFAFYGKGGIGKSTTVSNVALLFLQDGERVLQIGCDPKADSSHLHVDIHDIRPLLHDLMGDGRTAGAMSEEQLLSYVVEGRSGVFCLETGGMEPGVGCAGLGLSTALKVYDRVPGFWEGFDTVIFDVVGDVVCGGFAVPLRIRRAREVYILVSGDVASIYAANNIARAVVNNAGAGSRLAGLVHNRAAESDAVSAEIVGRFAESIGTRVAGAIPSDPLIMEAAARGATVVEHAPESPVADAYRAVYRAVRDVDEADLVVPTPMGNVQLFEFLKDSGVYGRP